MMWQWQYISALLCAVLQSIDISCRLHSLLLWPMLGQTDGRTPYRFIDCSVIATNWQPHYGKKVNGLTDFTTHYWY